MQFSLFEWLYILTNIFWTYTIYKFMGIFFETPRYSKVVELVSYIGYYIFITVIFLMVNIPIVLMFSNLAAFIMLSCIYESNLKNRLLSSVFIYLVLLGVEMMVVLITGYFNFPIFSTNNYSSIFGLVFSRILTYVAVLVLNNFKNIKRGEAVPNSSWICIVLIPTSSLYVILLLLQAREISSGHVMTGVILILLINFATFHLYDVITAALSEKMEGLLILEQNKYYDRQFELMKASLHNTKMIKHDLKNHMFSIRSLVENGDRKEALDYISDIMADVGTRQDYASSGNTIIDSIINFKFQEAEQNGIKTVLDLKIPENLKIPSFDMTIILGNILDNALKAVSLVSDNPFINLKIKYDKGRLLIQSDNPFVGEINEEAGRLLTTKENNENHGIGLTSVNKVIQKYDGTMSIDYNSNIFSISILMYVD